ncbi:MAG TPA: 50S ribosomal protein L24 [Vicinamibacterales bacterium]|nr:50S ribosomal protein L24 [Vicinamibacterales bacterium]
MAKLKMPVRKNDMVVVQAGKDRGKRGRILRVVAAKNRVVVEGVNMIKRHTRPNPQKNVKGGIVEREAPIHASNVMLLDPDTNEPTRVGIKTLSDGRRVRIGRKSGAVVDK